MGDASLSVAFTVEVPFVALQLIQERQWVLHDGATGTQSASGLCFEKTYASERRADTRVRSIFPVEIYLLVIDEVGNHGSSLSELKGTLSAMSLVCRLFRALCFRQVFKCVWLPCRMFGEFSDKKGSSAWLRSIESGEAQALLAATSVERCALNRVLEPPEPSGLFNALNSMWSLFHQPQPRVVAPTDGDLVTALAAFKNLTVLHINHFPMSMPLLETLMRLQKLTVLTITDCYEVLEPPTPLHNVDRAGVVVLEVTGCGSDGGSEFDAYIPLIAQLVNRRFLHSLSTDDIPLLNALICGGEISTAVEHLHISVSDEAEEYPQLNRYLARCPKLKSLSVRTPTESAIPPTACPELHTLECLPFMAAEILNTNRPISKLKLHSGLGPEESESIATIIHGLTSRKADSPLTELSLSASDFESLWNYPKRDVLDVTTLTIMTNYDFLQEIMLCLDLLSWRQSCILATTLRIETPTPSREDHYVARQELDLVGQRRYLLDIINVMDEQLPNLKCLNVGGVFEWRRSSIDNHWHPLVVDKNLLQAILEGPSGTVVRDVESCIASAFLSGTLSLEVIHKRRIGVV